MSDVLLRVALRAGEAAFWATADDEVLPGGPLAVAMREAIATYLEHIETDMRGGVPGARLVELADEIRARS